jgi:DNA repair photolyase
VDAIRGRGAADNPPGRFERIEFVPDPGDPDAPSPKTLFYRDASKSLITTNDSPDVGFEASINPYRGCEHGCSYCYARPYHEYLGFSAGLDFETRIMVKEDAPALLRDELLRKSWQPKSLSR